MEIEKAILKEIVSTTANNAARQANIFGCLRVFTQDKQLKIQSMNTMSVEAFVDLDSDDVKLDVFVHAQNLLRAVQHFNKRIAIGLDGDALVLSEGKFVQRLKTVGEADRDVWQFPNEPEECFKIHETARRTLFHRIDCIPDSKQDGAFRGSVIFSHNGSAFETIATDGKVLTQRKYPNTDITDFELKLPVRMASIIAGETGEMSVGIESHSNIPNMAMFKFDHVKYFTRLGLFPMPNLESIIKIGRESAFKICAGDLRDAISRFSEMTSVVINWKDCELALSATGEFGAIDDVISVTETYNQNFARYNPTYILKCIANLDDDVEVLVSFAGTQLRGLVFESQNNYAVCAGLLS